MSAKTSDKRWLRATWPKIFLFLHCQFQLPQIISAASNNFQLPQIISVGDGSRSKDPKAGYFSNSYFQTMIFLLYFPSQDLFSSKAFSIQELFVFFQPEFSTSIAIFSCKLPQLLLFDPFLPSHYIDI